MPIMNFHLQDFRGRIDTVVPHKAIISVKRGDKEERALVMYDKVKFNGISLPENGTLEDYIREGTIVSFSAHQINESGYDRCGWFVTQIMHHDVIRKLFPYIYCNDLATPGVFNRCGTVTLVTNRQGVLTFKSDNGRYERVFFLASKMYIHGTRLKSSLKGHLHVEEGTELYFDAVPCHSYENENECQWFATVVWYRCKKPRMDYDIHEKYLEDASFLNKIKSIAFNPRSIFICGEGHVLAIINAEYGIALGSMKSNVWQSILFHRSMCFLFKLNLSTKDLREVFKKGDKVSFIAVPSPKKIAQLIATQISVYTDPKLGRLS